MIRDQFPDHQCDEAEHTESGKDSNVVRREPILALPGIEQLLLALPPLDPGPAAKRGRVIPLRR